MDFGPALILSTDLSESIRNRLIASSITLLYRVQNLRIHETQLFVFGYVLQLLQFYQSNSI